MLRGFYRRHAERVPSVDPETAGGAQYNVETLTLFAEYTRRGGLRQKLRAGATLADTIRAYVGAVRKLQSREAQCDIAPEKPGGSLALALKSMRAEDPPAGTRKL
eukprot:2504707-Pleurochrysis_carterae.AAC.1